MESTVQMMKKINLFINSTKNVIFKINSVKRIEAEKFLSTRTNAVVCDVRIILFEKNFTHVHGYMNIDNKLQILLSILYYFSFLIVITCLLTH